MAGHEHTQYVINKEVTGCYDQIITNFSLKNYDDAKKTYHSGIVNMGARMDRVGVEVFGH